jgi:hypothetical protein
LDEIKSTPYIPTYNAFFSWEELNVGDRGNLSKGINGNPNSFTWTTNANGKYEIVSLFATIPVGILIAYHYLAKSVY